MIPMGVGKNEIVAMDAFFEELVSKSSNPGTSVDNDDIAAPGPNFDASGVTTIFDVFFA